MTTKPQSTDPTLEPIYVASRASIPERGIMWRQLRAEGIPITSSWIDEDGEGETADFGDLWLRITNEIAAASALVLYAERDDFPLKGALLEAGVALGMGKPVFVCLPDLGVLPRNYRPVGSWVAHPSVTRCDHIKKAVWLATRAHVSSSVAPTVDDLLRDAGAILCVNDPDVGARVEIKFSELEDAQRLHKALAESRAAATPVQARVPAEGERNPRRPYCAHCKGKGWFDGLEVPCRWCNPGGEFRALFTPSATKPIPHHPLCGKEIIPATALEETAEFKAYSQAIEDAMAAIRAESQGGGYWAAAYINAIARRCSPHVYAAKTRTERDTAYADGYNDGFRQGKQSRAAASPVAPVEQSETEFEQLSREQIVQAITDVQEARESHVQWANHLRNEKHALCEGCDSFAAHIGTAEYHDEWIAKYDNVIAVLARVPFTAPAPSAATQDEANLTAFKWAETLSEAEQDVVLASSLRRLQNMINSVAATTPSSTHARAAAEEIFEFGKYDLEPERAKAQIAAIIERYCSPAAGESVLTKEDDQE